MLFVPDKKKYIYITLSTPAQHPDRQFTFSRPRVMANTHTKKEELQPQFDSSPGSAFLDQPACASQGEDSGTLSVERSGEYKKGPFYPSGKPQFDVLIFIVGLNSN